MSLLQNKTSNKVKCKAKSKRSGKQCTNPPIRGGTVCRMHGGAAPQVRAKAEEQLRMARDELMEILLTIARDATQSASDRLKAITWALERAGFKAGLDLDIRGELKTKGYLEALKDMFDAEGPKEAKRTKEIEARQNRKAITAEPEPQARILVSTDDSLPKSWR